jgi:hypothetical protein
VHDLDLSRIGQWRNVSLGMVPALEPDGVQTRGIEQVTISGRHGEAGLVHRGAPIERISMISEPVSFDDCATGLRHAPQSILDHQGMQIVREGDDGNGAAAPV